MPYSKSQLISLIQCIDFTTLDNTDNETKIKAFVEKANKGINGILPAAVCVYSNFGRLTKSLVDNKINVAVVAGSFPSGQTLSQVKINEVKEASNQDIDEIDIVINRGAFLDKNYSFVTNEIALMRNASQGKILKVILETGELIDTEKISIASQIAIDAGADFIKTSTGKSTIGATPEAVRTMCMVIKNHFEKTGIKIGIKPSGGIKTVDDALVYWNIVDEINGSQWLSPDLFRIGASSLFDNLAIAIENAD